MSKLPNPVDIIVGRNIRIHRNRLGMSQETLADTLGVTFQQIQKYEKGANRVSASRLFQIAKSLGISVIDLYAGADMPDPRPLAAPSAKAMDLARRFDAMPSDRQEAISAITRTIEKLSAMPAVNTNG